MDIQKYIDNPKLIKKHGMENNKEIILKILHHNGGALKYASSELKNNAEVVLKAVRNNSLSLKYASKELMNNKEFVVNAVLFIGLPFAKIKRKFYNDMDVIIASLGNNNCDRAFHFAGKTLKKSKLFRTTLTELGYDYRIYL